MTGAAGADRARPTGYRRTTVEEQSEDAAALIESAAEAPAVVCGAGLGAVIALDLLLRRPELVSGAVLIEPPLLALVPAATEALSEDRRRTGGRGRRSRREGAGRALPLRRAPGARAGRRAGCRRCMAAAARETARRACSPSWASPRVGGCRCRGSAGAEQPLADRHLDVDTAHCCARRRRPWPGGWRARPQREVEAGTGPPHLGAAAELARSWSRAQSVEGAAPPDLDHAAAAGEHGARPPAAPRGSRSGSRRGP